MNVQTAQRLTELRRTKGYSQEGLAQRLGLSRQAISKWERAESSPDTDNLIALARLYDISLDELLGVSPEAADDIADAAAFENRDRQDERRREERRQDQERAAEAISAATQASAAAAQAAQAAAAAVQAPRERHRERRGRRASLSTFPYVMLALILFFVLVGIWHFSWAWLVFLTIPIVRWVVCVIEDDLRGDDEDDAGAGVAR